MADVNERQYAAWKGSCGYVDWVADNCSCETCRSSSPDLTGPRVLTALTPHPDESLIGLLARVCARNWLPRLRAILSATTPTWHVLYNLAIREDLDYDQLAFACRLPYHEVDARRYRRVKLSENLPGINFHGATIPVYDLDVRSRRTCRSWAEAGYHSAFAHHGLVTHCPASGEILLDACPRCDRIFTWAKSAFHMCHSCGLNIAQHKGDILPRRIRKATALILNIIHPHPDRHLRAVDKLHPLLASVDRGTVFELGWRMGCVLSGQGLGARDEAAKLPFETRLRILATGSEALAKWPQTVVDALGGRIMGSDLPSFDLIRNARLIATAQNSWQDLRDAMHEAAPIPVSTRTALKSALAQGANSREIEHVLGVNQRVVQRLRGSVDLTPVLESGIVNSHQIFEAAGLANLRLMLEDRISVSAVSEALDVSRHGVEQLACLGHIHIHDHGPVRVGFARRQARKSDFVRLLQALNGAATKHGNTGREDAHPAIGDCTGRIIGMHAAMRAIGGREKPWGPAILAMLSGELPFELDRSTDGKFMSRVSIARADLHKLVNMHFDETDFAQFSFEPSINGQDAEELLNIYPKTMQAAKSAKVIPRPVKGKYHRQTIRALACQYISPAEILARWSGGTKKLPSFFKGRERLIQASTLGWLREAAEAVVVAQRPAPRKQAGSFEPAGRLPS